RGRGTDGDLRSFPTRRSSDLEFDVEERTCLGCKSVITPSPRERNKKLWCSPACRAKSKRAEGKSSEYAPRSMVRIRDCRYCDRLDRKSTRLNSSHVKISYAVF